MDTAKETTIPTKRYIASGPENPPPSLRKLNILRRLAPNIVGIPRKNVNSAASVLAVPISIAPIIVTPDLEVPGINAST